MMKLEVNRINNFLHLLLGVGCRKFLWLLFFISQNFQAGFYVNGDSSQLTVSGGAKIHVVSLNVVDSTDIDIRDIVVIRSNILDKDSIARSVDVITNEKILPKRKLYKADEFSRKLVQRIYPTNTDYFSIASKMRLECIFSSQYFNNIASFEKGDLYSSLFIKDLYIENSKESFFLNVRCIPNFILSRPPPAKILS